MYLKSVEIHGFKSFANKIILNFESGITGIVGPNGSGKSNVADAVRWVLGEQSAKQLRGAKMEDVIFSGTELKKAQSFAYVAITMDNSDHVLPIAYDEVTVARRVYRSGESEYLINGSSCRLRDVQELFLDTGIGKEGYSIIGQGQIEKIISGKPEERRELFDEAAGITKFKKRKAEAFKNLNEETANLNRVKDILSELERQVEPLFEQAETAKKYLTYRDELKKYETVNFIGEYDRTEETRAKAKEDEETAEKALGEIKEELTKIKEEYRELDDLLNEKASEIENINSEISENKIRKEKLEGNINLVREQISSAERDNENYNDRLKSAEEKLKVSEEEKEKYFLQKSVLSKKIEDFDKELTKLNDELERENELKLRLEGEKERKIKESLEAEKEKAEANGRIELYKSNLEQIKIKRLEINQKILRNKEVKDSLSLKLKDAENKAGEFSAEIERLNAALSAASESNQELRNVRAVKEKLYRDNQKNIMSEKALLNSLKNMAEKYDGYGNSVKRIMEHKKEEIGIIGVVADIIQVKESYELAIETAIGGSIQNIVTDKEETAKRTISWLKQNKYGRATFLPLDAMVLHNPGNFGGALNEQGIIGLAASLVNYETKYAGVVSHLLGRILVADNMDSAVRIARKYRYSLRIVTLEGEQLNPGGAISGGAFKNMGGLLGRAREIEENTEKIKTLEEELNQVRTEIDEINVSISENKRSAELYRENISELKIKLSTEMNNKKQLEERIAENDKLFEEIKLDADTVDKEKENVVSEIDRLNRILNGETDGEEDYASVINKLDREIALRAENIERFKELSDKNKMKSVSINAEINFVQTNLDRVEDERIKISDEITKLNESHLEFSEVLGIKQVEETGFLEEIRELEKEESEKEGVLERLILERSDITKKHKGLFDRREELTENSVRLDKEVFRLSGTVEKAEATLETLVEYMLEEYNITYSEAVKNYSGHDKELTPFALKKLITGHKNLIKDLGNVNVNAIEDYKEISGRYELFKTQHDDIVKAEEVLKNVIEELDKRMREQFEESFSDINAQFDKAFGELFGGGRGKLELTDGEDILEAGIKIIAQPPGKKLQNMMQLSGGEKALTAIALLFAIQNLKPSPFCLLDEIEAALDDSNVVRFADYLHKLTKNTQFIVITHRRGTMNSADVLYGITMQEKGVSTMISVNLIEAELSN